MRGHRILASLSLVLVGLGSSYICWETYLYLMAGSDMSGAVMAIVKIVGGLVLVLSSMFLRGLAKGLKSRSGSMVG